MFAVHALTHGLEAATKIHVFYPDSFHRNQKGQKSLKNKNLL